MPNKNPAMSSCWPDVILIPLTYWFLMWPFSSLLFNYLQNTQLV